MHRAQLLQKLTLGSASLLLCATLTAQDAAPPAQQPTTVLHTSTQLVIVDVTVQDAAGHPIHDLPRDSFRLVENKSPQTVRNFEEHSNAVDAASKPVEITPMPPGTFTDYTPTRGSGPLNILLLDTLNTPMKDQAFVRNQLKEYVKKADSTANIAIFGLGSKLTILQGFTTSPQVLRDAVEHKLVPRASSLLDDPVGTNADQQNLSDVVSDSAVPGDANMAQTVANLQQFEAETAAFQLKLRMEYTLDAFNQLAHYLYAFPGRKNLIWFSGSFPLNILPDNSIQDPFAVVASAEDEYRSVTNLLTRAQVAVYPVDARGLMTNPAFDAANSGSKYARSPTAFSKDIAKFGASQADEHSTMQQMADDTGGHAFYNTNGLADAVKQAIDTGANYYTLTYSPTNHDWNGQYRNIHIELTGAAAARGLKLAYRHGYFADDPDKPHNANSTATITSEEAASTHSAAGYARAALARGAPAPSEILFKVRVAPVTTELEDTVAQGNNTDPLNKPKGPFRRFQVDFVALADNITWNALPNGQRTGTVAFEAFVYDPDGRLIVSSSRALQLKITPETYNALLRNGMKTAIQISAPAKSETYMRIAIHDMVSNRFGVVEIPTSTVSHLPVVPTAQLPPAPSTKSPPPPR